VVIPEWTGSGEKNPLKRPSSWKSVPARSGASVERSQHARPATVARAVERARTP
jgi:hypothetical protein